MGFDGVNLHHPTMKWSMSCTTHCSTTVSADQGLTLVHYSAQHKHTSWDTLGA